MFEPTIGFYNPASIYPYATEASIASVRLVYPNAPISMSCDNSKYDYSDLCQRFGVKYFHYYETIGYPSGALGYTKKNMLTWLDRAFVSVSQLGTDYFSMWEDDCILVKKITIEPDWIMAGHCFLFEDQVPKMPDSFLKLIEDFSGVRPSTNLYNCGGGSLFHTKTFLDNYQRIRQYWHTNFDRIQREIYSAVGFIDCFITLFFYMCGAKLVENHRIHNNYPLQKPFDFAKLSNDIEIVHYVKDLY